MKTAETLSTIREANRSAYFLMRDTMKRRAETLVNIKAWDSRISRYNAEWAAGIEDSFDEQAGERLSFCNVLNKIHPAHLDQIADEMRTFQ